MTIYRSITGSVEDPLLHVEIRHFPLTCVVFPLVLMLIAHLCPSEAAAQSQQPYYQGDYRQQRFQYERAMEQWRQRNTPLDLEYASVRVMGGGGVDFGNDEDVMFGNIFAIGGPVFSISTSEFFFIPEVGYSLHIIKREEGEYDVFHFSHIAVFGARIGVGFSGYFDHTFGLDLFARILMGGEDHRFALGAHLGMSMTGFAHLIFVELGYQVLTTFLPDTAHVFMFGVGLDIPHMAMRGI